MGNTITVDEALVMLQEIATTVATGDYEKAHSLEDDLKQRALATCGALASICDKSAQFEFPRHCA